MKFAHQQIMSKQPRSAAALRPRTLIKGKKGTEATATEATRSVITPGTQTMSRNTALTCPLDRLSAAERNAAVKKLTAREREAIMENTAEREEELPSLVIMKSLISIYSFEEMKQQAVVNVTNDNSSGRNSVDDPRMGIVGNMSPCWTCAQLDCTGHFGLVEFRHPIYNPMFIREVVSVLTCVCNECGGLLLTKGEIVKEGLLNMNSEQRLRALEERSKDRPCLRRKETLKGGEVLQCRKNPVYILTGTKSADQITYKNAKIRNAPDDETIYIKPIVDSEEESNSVEAILRRITPEDAELMGFSNTSHPVRMIMRGLLVIPPIARPPVNDGGSSLPDQLTTQYITIVRMNNAIDPKNPTMKSVSDLFASVKKLIFNTDGKRIGAREFMSISARIQGKEAILRGMMMGKRGDYCGRTVLGPDPSLRFGQIRIPDAWAPVLTKKIYVTPLNRDYLQQLISPSLTAQQILSLLPHRDPRELQKLLDLAPLTLAKLVPHMPDIRPSDYSTLSTYLRPRITHYTPGGSEYKIRRRAVIATKQYNLRIGDIVDRWLQNGDRVVFNRQPTLQRQSMMSYEVVLGKQMTIGLHLSVTTPHNADFDGDEGNISDPQDFEVEAEVAELIDVRECVMSAQQNRPMIGLVYDVITGAYLLTDPRTTVSDMLFSDCLQLMTQRSQLPSLYQRLRRYQVDPRSGKALFSALLPSDFYYQSGSVLIVDGVLIQGRITKRQIGTAHRSIIQEMWKNYGKYRVADFLTDAPFVINRWLDERGFTVGPADCVHPRIDRIMKEEIAKVKVKIEALGGPLIDPLEEEHREKQVVALVQSLKGLGARLAKEIMLGTKGHATSLNELLVRLGVVVQQISAGNISQATTLFRNLDDDLEGFEKGYIEQRAASAMSRNLAPFGSSRGETSNLGELEEYNVTHFSELRAQEPVQPTRTEEDIEAIDAPATPEGILRRIDWIAQNMIRLAKQGALVAIAEQLQDFRGDIWESTDINHIVELIKRLRTLGTRLEEAAPTGDNSIGMMADEVGGGGKGALFNVAQIMGMVGQQFYRGARLKPSLSGGTRLLPVFDEGDIDPESHGLIIESFWKGMSPQNLFLHHAGGREGLMDTALKTAETGAMHHKIVKALENVKVAHDGSVRNTTGTIFQFKYGEDGYDGAELLKVSSRGYTDLASFVDIKSLAAKLNVKHGWVPASAVANIRNRETSSVTPFTQLSPLNQERLVEDRVKRILAGDTPRLTNPSPLTDDEEIEVIAGAMLREQGYEPYSVTNWTERVQTLVVGLREGTISYPPEEWINEVLGRYNIRRLARQELEQGAIAPITYHQRQRMIAERMSDLAEGAEPKISIAPRLLPTMEVTQGELGTLSDLHDQFGRQIPAITTANRANYLRYLRIAEDEIDSGHYPEVKPAAYCEFNGQPQEEPCVEPPISKYTRYERARLLGARAIMLAKGAPPLIDPGNLTDVLDIARKELEAGVIPITVKRVLPDGTVIEI